MPSDPRALRGLVGARDLAQPLLTLRVAEGRVELSGATTANWVAKNANLLVDGYGSPASVGLLLPLHWQTACLLLAALATGATAVVGTQPDDVTGADLVLTTADRAGEVRGPLDVLVVSTHPLGAPLPGVPAGVGDHAREVPSYGDHWGGTAPTRPVVLAGSVPVEPAAVDAGPDDRVLVAVAPGTADGAGLLLGLLRAGAALVLAPDPGGLDLRAVVREEGVTATAGVDAEGLRRLG